MVPLYGRTVLWIVPALAVGVGGSRIEPRDSRSRASEAPNVARLAIGVIVVAGVIRLSDDMMAQQQRLIPASSVRTRSETSTTQRQSDSVDRSPQPGDAILATKLASPPIWWSSSEVPIRTMPRHTANARSSRDEIW